MNSINVKVICEHEESEVIVNIIGLTKQEIKELFNSYNNKYNNNEFNGDFEMYLISKNIVYSFPKINYSIEINI